MPNKLITELTLQELYYFVASIEGLTFAPDAEGNTLQVADDKQVFVKNKDGRVFAYRPTRNWRLGGPLLQKHNISIQKVGPKWVADVDREACAIANHALTAAMRALVMLKFGESVHVP